MPHPLATFFSDEKAFLQNCHDALTHVGEATYQNIVAPEDSIKGGPFGAALAMFNKDGAYEWLTDVCFNEVLLTGCASHHAEHMALSGKNFDKIITRLLELRGQEKVLILFSSAQSCVACHTKTEVFARELLRRGLIETGHFLVIYGAGYDETQKITGFNDKQYADALVMAGEDMFAGNLPIKIEKTRLEELPDNLYEIFDEQNEPCAVLTQGNEILALSENCHGEELFSGLEIGLIEKAHRQNHEKTNRGWDLEGVLYTNHGEIGPLLYTELLWTKISKITLVPPYFETWESQKTPNPHFFSVISCGYEAKEASISVFRDPYFENKAQRAWSMLSGTEKPALYNGALQVNADISCRVKTNKLFYAPDIKDIFESD